MKKTIVMRVGDFEIIVARRDVGHSQFSTTSLIAAARKRAIGKQWAFELGTRKQDHRRADERKILRRLIG